MTESAAAQLEKAQGLLASGDISGLLRHLRACSETLPLGDAAQLVAGAARTAGFGDLAQAAEAAAASGEGSTSQDGLVLFQFGYACIERGLSSLAVRPLTRVLELIPDAPPNVLGELVTALETTGQHGQALTVLEEHQSLMELSWQLRYLHTYNAVMAGDLDKAAGAWARLPEPEDTAWLPAYARIGHMLARSATAGQVAPLHRRDLRGWHYVLTGGILAGLSPYGFEEAMTGRWAYVNDSKEHCAATLRRLQLILETARAAPEAVMPLPDRSSQIIGTAAATVLGLPVAEFDPSQPAGHSLVVAYDLGRR